MIIFYYPSKDATVYSGSTPGKLESTDVTTLNTGLDEILEIDKWLPDDGTIPLVNKQAVSRAFVQFDYTSLSSSVSDGTITNPTYSLKLFSTDTTTEIPLSYTLEAYPLSQSWEMGIGKKDLNPIQTKGCTWTWRDTSGSNHWNNSGGDIILSKIISAELVSFKSSQTFEYNQNDINMDVTNTVTRQLTEHIPNNGFVIKHSALNETSSVAEYGSAKFFSRDTHTIYVPRLEVAFNDSTFITGSLNALDVSDGDVVMYMKGVNSEYKQDSIERFNVYGRRRIVTSSFSTTSKYLDVQYLPSNTFYPIKDLKTNEDVIPFSSNTKISCDSNGNYFNFRMSTLQQERMYKILYKIMSGNNVHIFDDNQFTFKVVK